MSRKMSIHAFPIFGEESDATSPGKPRPFIRPQATKTTRQQMREQSPSGIIHMDGMMGRTFTNWFLIRSALMMLAFTYVIDWAAMSAWAVLGG